MPYDADTGTIVWRLHLRSHPETVFRALATDGGRARFWGESALEQDGIIYFRFPNGMEWQGRILERQENVRFAVDYFGSRVEFALKADGGGGTDLVLTDRGVPAEDREETLAGWVSVLLALKGAVDHGIDLRNHDPSRTWDQGYVDN